MDSKKLIVFIVIGLSTAFNSKAALAVAYSRLPTNDINIGKWYDFIGVDGGIPPRTEIHASFTTANTLTEINNGIDNCPSNKTVFIAAGTYNVTGDLNCKSHVTVRGENDVNGRPATIFNRTSSGTPLFVLGLGSANPGSWYVGDMSGYTTRTVSSGATRGSRSIVTTAAPTGLSAGMLMIVSCGATSLGDGFSDFFRETTGRPAGQMVLVTNVSGSTIQFKDQLQAGQYSGTIQVHYNTDGLAEQLDRFGFENIKFTRDSAAVNGFTLQAVGTRECWLKNVEITKADQAEMLLDIYANYRLEVRDCNIHDFYDLSVDSSSSYATRIVQSTGTWLADTEIHDCPNAIAFFGSCLTAISGLYTTNHVYDQVPGFLSQGIFLHASHNEALLLEDSILFCRTFHDLNDPGGYIMVYNRNRIFGWDGAGGGRANDVFTDAWGNGYSTDHTNLFITLVGNIFGKDGEQTVRIDSNADFNTVDTIYRVSMGSSNTVLMVDNYNTVDDGIPSGELLGSNTREFSYIYPDNQNYSTHPIFGTNGPIDSHNFSSIDSTNNRAGYRFVHGRHYSNSQIGHRAKIKGIRLRKN